MSALWKPRRGPPSPVLAGDGLLHPAVVVAVVVLLLNDHVAKVRWPGPVTGKLSDVAGLVFFPLLLQAVYELGRVALRRPAPPSRRVVSACVLATGATFAAVQLSAVAGDAYRIVWAWLRWPLHLWSTTDAPTHVALTPDPGDLLTLPALGVAWYVGARRCSPAPTGDLSRARIVGRGARA